MKTLWTHCQGTDGLPLYQSEINNVFEIRAIKKNPIPYTTEIRSQLSRRIG